MDRLEQFKELLSEPKQRIKLHDFVADITKKLVSESGQDKLPVQVSSDGDLFIARLQKYEEILQTVLPFQMLLGRWGLPDHAEIAALPLRRLAGAIDATGGNAYLTEARWYPVFLLLYAGCIGAISGSNYQVVHKLAHSPVPNRDGRQNRDILLTSVFKAMGEIHDGFKLFPGLDRKHTPRSEHIYALLEPYADDNLYLGADYEEVFDRAEIMMAIEYMHIEHPEPGWPRGEPLGPRREVRVEKIVSRSTEPIDRRSVRCGKSWEPACAGLFGSSGTRFVELAEGLSRMLRRVSW